MEEKGLIRRERNPDDRRKVNIFLTDGGRALQDELLPYVIEVNEVAASDFAPDEIAQLRNLLEKFKNNLGASEVDAAGQLRFHPTDRIP